VNPESRAAGTECIALDSGFAGYARPPE